MPDSGNMPEWKKALRDVNTIGWIGFFILVVAIGFGSLYFDGSGQSNQSKPATSAVQAGTK